MGKIKIKGIYSNALYELFLEEGYKKGENTSDELVLESKDLSLGDTSLYDKEDKNGIVIHGCCSDELVKIIKKRLPDILIRKKEVGDIYVGFVKKLNDGKAIISIGNKLEGVLDLKDVDYIKLGSKILVQVKNVKKDIIELSTQLRLFGESMILIKNGFTKVSKYIKNLNQRERLENLTKELQIKDWGILWKSLAEDKTKEQLINEINDLLNQEKEIMKEFNKINEPKLIRKGFSLYMIDFGLLSKLKLDEIRRNLMTTVPSHHLLKSGGYTLLTDFAEVLLNHVPYEKIKETLTHILRRLGPKEGYPYLIKRISLNGLESSDKGKVINSENEVVIEDTNKIKVIKPGNWYILNKENDVEIFDITTPIEVFPEFARCIDLGVKVIKKNHGIEVVGKEILDEALLKGLITNDLYTNVNKVIEEVMKNGRE